MNLLDAHGRLWLNDPDQSRGSGSIISPSRPLLLLREGGNEEETHRLSSSNLAMLLRGELGTAEQLFPSAQIRTKKLGQGWAPSSQLVHPKETGENGNFWALRTNHIDVLPQTSAPSPKFSSCSLSWCWFPRGSASSYLPSCFHHTSVL